MKVSSPKLEGTVIRLGTMVFWFLFWLLNVVDKFLNEPVFLWVGKNRFGQFVNYFTSIGVTDTRIPLIFLIFVTLLEIAALVLIGVALVKTFLHKHKDARACFFWGTFVGLFIFSFFAIGDQIFGDRVELLEHSTYWIALIISWYAFKTAD